MESKPKKTILIDEIQYCWCRGHSNYELCDDFSWDKRTTNRRTSNCKVYNNQRVRIIRQVNKEKITNQEASNKILTLLGYNLEEDIHQQFLERHNL